MNNTMYRKVSVEEELPPMNEFVTCFYENGETMVFKRYETGSTTVATNGTTNTELEATILREWAWTMRDGIADRTPKEGKITHWLKEVEDSIPYPIDTLFLDSGEEIFVYIGVVTIKTTKEVVKQALLNYIKQL